MAKSLASTLAGMSAPQGLLVATAVTGYVSWSYSSAAKLQDTKAFVAAWRQIAKRGYAALLNAAADTTATLDTTAKPAALSPASAAEAQRPASQQSERRAAVLSLTRTVSAAGVATVMCSTLPYFWA